MRKRFIITLFLFCSVATIFAQKPKSKFSKPEDATSVFVIGDWGRQGEYKQKQLADMMGAIAKTIEPEFIISTGDNFYPNGVQSVSDPQWQNSFENVYTAHALNCNWFVVLGNHDYRGNPDAEIAYTSVSRRWNMPSEYFSFEQELEDGSTALFAFIDTNPLNDEYYEEKKYKETVSKRDTTAQIAWLHKTLSESKADWKIVTGHHPLYTGGKRKNEPNHIRPHLEYILKKYEVDVYLAGHEHDLQFIKPEGNTYHVVSGSGSEVRKTGYLNETLFAEAVQGFAILTINKDSLNVQFVDYTGKRLFQNSIQK